VARTDTAGFHPEKHRPPLSGATGMKRWKKLVIVLAAVCVSLVLLEVGLRVYEQVRFGVPILGDVPNPHVEPDEHLGWKPRAEVTLREERRDFAGDRYAVDYRTVRDGFRMWGDVGSDRLKILFVGDSFTQAIRISNDRTYFAGAGRRLNAEIFAVGGLGYGTLQELLLIEQHLDTIRPDIVVLQLCSNDVINNDHELESRSQRNNRLQRRPYLKPDGQIEYRVPRDPVLGRLRWLAERSRLCRIVLLNLARLRASQSRETVEDDILSERDRHAGYQQALQTTSALIRRIKVRCGDTPLVLFPADDNLPFHKGFEQIAGELDLLFVAGAGRAHRRAQEAGKETRADDGAHWNEHGHALAGELLAEGLMPLVTRRREGVHSGAKSPEE
jgi:lysophospholipase L1-like esterase